MLDPVYCVQILATGNSIKTSKGLKIQNPSKSGCMTSVKVVFVVWWYVTEFPKKNGVLDKVYVVRC